MCLVVTLDDKNQPIVELLHDESAGLNVHSGEDSKALSGTSSEGLEKVMKLLLDVRADANVERNVCPY